MQPMHDWVGEVSSYRRPSHAMQAMQRHPQRTRGPETDMSFDKTSGGALDAVVGMQTNASAGPLSNSINTTKV
ncbi:hypothetical protein CFAM422_002548 [Trichoderma lentiforme]|uniref:Uncharacterized protein n=1 Tax=Trichoderma lentiforme TaxID=1567552 RepID=A0A9P4XM64_9HYPO|nr:hypothetical protein CFAM422_002548 [Trichoderma lentiforme]